MLQCLHSLGLQYGGTPGSTVVPSSKGPSSMFLCGSWWPYTVASLLFTVALYCGIFIFHADSILWHFYCSWWLYTVASLLFMVVLLCGTFVVHGGPIVWHLCCSWWPYCVAPLLFMVALFCGICVVHGGAIVWHLMLFQLALLMLL